MGILEIILIGLVVGAVARLLIPGRQPLGILGTIAMGVVGSLLGWWFAREVVGTARAPWLWAIAGAVVVILVWEAVTGRRGTLIRR